MSIHKGCYIARQRMDGTNKLKYIITFLANVSKQLVDIITQEKDFFNFNQEQVAQIIKQMNALTEDRLQAELADIFAGR